MYTYIKKESLVHSLDPGLKIVVLGFISVLCFFAGLEMVLLMLAYVLLLSVLSKAGKETLLLPKFIALLVMLLFTVQAFFLGRPGNALLVSARLLVLFYSSQLIAVTTSPKKTLQALKGLGLPSQLAFVFSTALRLLPAIELEAKQIMDAQKSRGLDLDTKNPVKRIRNLLPIIIPLFSNSLQRAQNMGLALESKGYSARISD